MKFIRRFLIFLGVILLVFFITVIVLFSFLKHLKLKDIVENEIEDSLGINVSIEKIEFSPLLVHLAAKGVTIHNPPGFAEDELAYINSIHFLLDPMEMLIKAKPNIYGCALDLKRLNIIKNNKGLINIEVIQPAKDGNLAGKDKAPFFFDILVLSVGEVRYADYSKGTKKENTYPIGIKMATFIGLKDEQEVVRLIVFKAIENTNIGKLINLKIVPVVSQIGDTMDSAWSTAKSGAKSIWGITVLPFNILFSK